jgi:glycosyltransferase involved in cell wall biosynthesis
MENKIAISVVIPVYNASKFIKDTLDSVCAQTLTNIEIICMNDCSTDNSLEILNSYAERDSRIHVYSNQVNSGSAIARQNVFPYIKGKYIAFIDSDDIIDNDYLFKLYEKTKKDDYDIVCSNVKFHALDGKIEICDFPTIYNDGSVDILKLMTKFLISVQKTDNLRRVMLFGVWAKIYKTEFILKEQIVFTSEREVSNEDFLFNLQAFLKANKVAYVSDTYYNYKVVAGSLSKSYYLRSFDIRSKSLLMAKEMINNSNVLYKNDLLERLYYRTWIVFVYSSSNELQRNPSGLIAALKQIKENACTPLLREALGKVKLRNVAVSGWYRVYMFILYVYVKCFC